LPDNEQEALADLLIEEMRSSQRWSDLFTDPRCEKLLERLLADTSAEDDAGEREEVTADAFLP
jgi:hypothetical protein